MRKWKILFIGDYYVGKTSLLMTYYEKKLPEEYLPTVFESFSNIFQIKNEEIERIEENEQNQIENEQNQQNQQNQIEIENKFQIEFWDSAIHEDNYRFLQIFCQEADIIVFCFSIIDYYSFENIQSFWIPNTEKYLKNKKIVLIGTKIDLRNNEERINQLKEKNQKLITKEEGIELAKKIKAIKYFECSSFNQKGIETIFNEIALICIGKYDKKEKKKGSIFVGSRVVGKTSLLLTYYEKKLPEKYIPIIFDNFQKTFKIEENKEIEISFWDSERPEDRDRLFPLIYPETDLIAICFSIIDSNSFERIENFWIPEIEQYSPNSKEF
ncbi:ras-like gtp-binding protein rho [Anaeramoeba ignava]|uniref:Ras-like gtp-binding protein rho n=1 Tax=Anaeramoeba ignava TaxID=1746090 RepID=A0A9Q0LN27_ANAIG|nr:ras-like gtp-binding protein rho [Anaeramoeba ignava]